MNFNPKILINFIKYLYLICIYLIYSFMWIVSIIQFKRKKILIKRIIIIKTVEKEDNKMSTFNVWLISPREESR